MKITLHPYERPLFYPPPAQGQRHLSGKLIDVPLVHAIYEIYVEWHALLLKFPKAQRYSLGQTVNAALLTALENILAAAATSASQVKRGHITSASVKLDLLKLLVRLAKDCECLTEKQYRSVESKLYHAGKMLGGWQKSLG